MYIFLNNTVIGETKGRIVIDDEKKYVTKLTILIIVTVFTGGAAHACPAVGREPGTGF